MRVSLSGQEWTISVSRLLGTNQNDTPVKSSYFGIVDTAGIPKNDYYLYQSQWLALDQQPMVHILPHWNWEIHKSYQQVVDKYGDIPVRVYSNAGSVELFLNGKSQGGKTFQENGLQTVENTKREKDLTNSISNGAWLINQENCML